MALPPPKPTVNQPMMGPSSTAGGMSLGSPSGGEPDGDTDPGGAAGINDCLQDLIEAGLTVSKNPDGSLTLSGDIPPDAPTSDGAGSDPSGGGDPGDASPGGASGLFG